jgi:hypothetical protein
MTWISDILRNENILEYFISLLADLQSLQAYFQIDPLEMDITMKNHSNTTKISASIAKIPVWIQGILKGSLKHSSQLSLLINIWLHSEIR